MHCITPCNSNSRSIRNSHLRQTWMAVQCMTLE